MSDVQTLFTKESSLIGIYQVFSLSSPNFLHGKRVTVLKRRSEISGQKQYTTGIKRFGPNEVIDTLFI